MNAVLTLKLNNIGKVKQGMVNVLPGIRVLKFLKEAVIYALIHSVP